MKKAFLLQLINNKVEPANGEHSKRTLFDIVSVDFVGSSSLFERQRIQHAKQYSVMILMLKLMLAGSALPSGLHHVFMSCRSLYEYVMCPSDRGMKMNITTGLSLRFHFISLDSFDVWSPIVVCQ